MEKGFECQQCGDCCYGEGGIRLDPDEVENIARFLHLPPEAFLSRYCEKKNGRTYIRTGSDGFCIMFDKEERCLIHPVKPKPCAQWPFFPAIVGDKENWEAAKGACPGINRDCSFETFVKQAKA